MQNRKNLLDIIQLMGRDMMCRSKGVLIVDSAGSNDSFWFSWRILTGMWSWMVLPIWKRNSWSRRISSPSFSISRRAQKDRYSDNASVRSFHAQSYAR